MSSQTRIYFKLKQIALKEGSSEQIKFEIRLNEEVLSISVSISCNLESFPRIRCIPCQKSKY